MVHKSTMSIRGWVATNPVCRSTASGAHVTSFRIADTVRRRDPDSGEWSDTKTTWYTARVWGEQALNVAESLRKSDPVIVSGHPWLEEWTKSDGQPATQLVLDAEAIGPDLSRGTAQFRRMNRVVHLEGEPDAGGGASSEGFVPVSEPDRTGGDQPGSERGGEATDDIGDLAEQSALEEDLAEEIDDAVRATA